MSELKTNNVISMRKFTKLFLLLAATLFAFVACEVVEPTPEPDPRPEPPIEEPPVEEPTDASFAIKVEEVHASWAIT